MVLSSLYPEKHLDMSVLLEVGCADLCSRSLTKSGSYMNQRGKTRKGRNIFESNLQEIWVKTHWAASLGTCFIPLYKCRLQFSRNQTQSRHATPSNLRPEKKKSGLDWIPVNSSVKVVWHWGSLNRVEMSYFYRICWQKTMVLTWKQYRNLWKIITARSQTWRVPLIVQLEFL